MSTILECYIGSQEKLVSIIYWSIQEKNEPYLMLMEPYPLIMQFRPLSVKVQLFPLPLVMIKLLPFY
uniref:Uncharacterized protein n=1 Tax=Amphimedon queenslandica TaxID=400682 RepID=A0A1X7TA95_AMPQE